MIYIEHLCAADLDQHDGPWFGDSSAIAYEGVRHLENSFHQRGVKKAKTTYDPLVEDAVSIELGYSTMAGGSELQMSAWRKGEAFELRATAKAPERPGGPNRHWQARIDTLASAASCRGPTAC